jgi:hypothetical protein
MPNSKPGNIHPAPKSSKTKGAASQKGKARARILVRGILHLTACLEDLMFATRKSASADQCLSQARKESGNEG